MPWHSTVIGITERGLHLNLSGLLARALVSFSASAVVCTNAACIDEAA
jgi:hypothetical protein